MVKRGEVWLAALDPTVGTEIQKTRPCLIVSPDELNTRLPTVLAAPMTTDSRPSPFRVPITFRRKQGSILPEQMRVLDRERLISRLGRVDPTVLRAVLALLGDMFAE